MRPLHILISAVALTSTSGSLGAQAFWTKQAPIPSAQSISSVAAISVDEFWCSSAPWPFSNNGQIAHTISAGLTWEVMDLDPGGVNAVFFVDPQYGWTAGGAFRHTTDGGQTWVTDNNWGSIYDLYFLDRQRGWACGNGGVAYYTANGGLAWNAVSTPAGTTLGSIWFTDAANGWTASIGGRIIKTTDGGQSWTINANTGAYLATIQFATPLDGWAIGGDTFLRTTDGGVTWVPQTVPAGTWCHGARFHDSMNGIAVGDGGMILRTVDGGQTWTTVRPYGSGPGLADVEYADALTVVASGGKGVLLHSIDAGLTWSPIQSGGWGITRALDVHDGSLAWAASQSGEILRFTTPGTRWERVSVDGFNISGDLQDVDFVNDQVGWTVGKGEGYGRIAGSTDGGLTWQLQHTDSGHSYFGVAAFDTQTAIAFGGGPNIGVIMRTTDGGASWAETGPNEYFKSACTVGATTGWVVGTHIYKTTDAGATWVQQYQATGPLLAGISFADPNFGWAVGFANQLLRTTDGGQTWFPQVSGAPGGTGLMGVWAIDSTTAWIAGWNGFVARTTNGGLTWEEEPILGITDAFFEDIEFVDAEVGWVAGDYGIFHRTPPGDCSQIAIHCLANPNSTGQAALIDWSGTCVSAANSFTLHAGPVPNQPFIFIFGPEQTQVLLGNGFLCVGGTLTRMNPPGTASGNMAERQVDLPAYGFSPGMSTNFQCWYRDPGAQGGTFNLSNALYVTFE